MLKNSLQFLMAVALAVVLTYCEPLQICTPPLLGRTIILDAGHGLGADNVFYDYSEQEAMLGLALMIKPKLEELGATVHLTRSTPENVPLHTRPALVNKWTLQVLQNARGCEYEIAEIARLIYVMEKIIADPGSYAPIYMNAPFDRSRSRAVHAYMRQIFYLQNDPIVYNNFLFISLHSNATPRPINTSTNGADVYIISNTTYYNINYFDQYTNFDHSWLFADILLDKIAQLGIARRSINYNSAFAVIRENNIPAVLVENGFHTNPYDRERLMCNVFLGNLATAYAEAIVKYFEQLALLINTDYTYIAFVACVVHLQAEDPHGSRGFRRSQRDYGR